MNASLYRQTGRQQKEKRGRHGGRIDVETGTDRQT